MSALIFLTGFLIISNLIQRIQMECLPSQRCILTQAEKNYFSIVITEHLNESITEERFLGLCDTKTLKKWRPCPFYSINEDDCCAPGDCHIYNKTCNLHGIASQPQCDCSATIGHHELVPIPDFPTCIMGGKCLNANCSIVSRRKVKRGSAMIYNCVPNMTKHSDVEQSRIIPLSLNWRQRYQVRRSVITPSPVIHHIRPKCINKRNTEKLHNSQQHCCVLKHRNRRQTSNFQLKNKNRNDFLLERKANFALQRILRSIIKSKQTRHGRREDIESTTVEVVEDDDDDDDDDDDIGEDIAMEEDKDLEEEISTTEGLEKDELNQIQNSEMKISKNFTNSDEEPKAEKPKILSKSYKSNILPNTLLIVLCNLLGFILTI